MKKLISIIMLTAFACAAEARESNDLLKANYLYRQLAFNEAIPYYEKIAATEGNMNIYIQLADCYRLTKNPEQAVAWYAQAIAIPGCPAEVKLHYAQMLMNLSRHDKAATALHDYLASKPDDRRAQNMLTSCIRANEMRAEMPSGIVTFLSINGNGSEFGPSLRNGMLVYTSDTAIASPGKTDMWTGKAFYNIYAVSCTNGNCNGNVEKVAANLNSKFHDGPGSFSADGKEMYFTRTNFTEKFLSKGAMPDQNGFVRLNVMVASGYDEGTKTFSKIAPFKYNDKSYSSAHPAISPDGTLLIFSSDREDGEGATDLYWSRKDAGGNWSAPQNVGRAINTEGDEMFPYLYDSKTLYFASNGHVGLGGLDIYKATWDERAQSFGEPERLGAPVNSPYDDMSVVLLPGGQSGYMSSNRPAAKAGDNIYFFNNQRLFLDVRVMDGYTNLPLSAATVKVKNPQKDDTYISGMNGDVFAPLMPQSQYTVHIEKIGYQPQDIDIPVYNGTGNDTIEKTVSLKPDFAINYNVVVMDEKSREMLDDALVVVARAGAGKADSAHNGAYMTSLQPNADYHVYAVKENYYANDKIISTKNMKNGAPIMLNDTIYMKKLEVGEVYKIDNIYYDYNKASIRTDAISSLDRLMELLTQYPQMTIQLNSHTDCRGSDSYNMRLSDARAHSVIKYLQQHGIRGMRLSYKGYGETKPIHKCDVCDQCTETQHQENRRTEFQIIGL